jgi:hypothetical protein
MKTREFEGNLIQTFCSLKISATLLMKRKKKKIRIHLPCAGKRGGQTVLCPIFLGQMKAATVQTAGRKQKTRDESSYYV